MGVLKNEVGRPSNEVIKTRKILKTVGLIVIFCIFFAIGYFAAGSSDEIGEEKINSEIKEEVKNVKKFDKTKITTKVAEQEYFPESNAYDLYVYGKKVELGNYIVGIGNVSVIENIAIVEVELINSKDLIIVDTEANLLFNPYDYTKMLYCTDSGYTSECYGFKVDGNKVTFYLHDLGQDPYMVCKTNYNNEVLNEYELTYENGKLSMPKKLSSLIGKEYITKHNISCE